MRLLLFFLLSACTHLPAVEQGIRERNLAGSWKSERGDRFAIGCSGSFSVDLNDDPVTTHETGAHVSDVSATGFTVSHWPLHDDHYDVAEWPKQNKMKAEGLVWTRTRALDCDAKPFWK